SAISITLNPAVCSSIGPLERFLMRHPRLWRLFNHKAAAAGNFAAEHLEDSNPAHRAVIVGYGPIGQMVYRILQERGIEPTIIEMNIDTYRRLRNEGRPVVYGDANRKEVLEQAGVAKASSLILSASGTGAASEAVRVAQEINPNIHVVARADFLQEAGKLRRAGASEVFVGEGEVALAIADSILRNLGSTPEQLDEARDQIRLTLYRTGR
ncbi:MAG TPA: NAD(P)-binding protein, partial [Bryobacteraceae bacterium]|nr:NAD(P)-binding protein [Bryobacteraceae bacterium]